MPHPASRPLLAAYRTRIRPTVPALVPVPVCKRFSVPATPAPIRHAQSDQILSSYIACWWGEKKITREKRKKKKKRPFPPNKQDQTEPLPSRLACTLRSHYCVPSKIRPSLRFLVVCMRYDGQSFSKTSRHYEHNVQMEFVDGATITAASSHFRFTSWLTQSFPLLDCRVLLQVTTTTPQFLQSVLNESFRSIPYRLSYGSESKAFHEVTRGLS